MAAAEQVKSVGRSIGFSARELFDGLRNRFDGVGSSLTLTEERCDLSSVRTLQKNDLLVRLLSTLTGLVVTFGVSYYGIRWLVSAMDPTRHEKKEAQKRAEKLMKSIGVGNTKLTDYELCIASNLIDPLSIVTDWDDIGGLTDTVQEIKETIIMPFKHHDLFAGSGLVQPPKGVLLYGPPGCGKTLIAKATAKAAGARFINLQVSTLVDKWYGESQKRAEAVFSLAQKLQPTIIFIDEIDSFLRVRASNDHEATSMMKTQFMSFWDGLMTDSNCWIMIIGATNRPTDVDAAILRRMPTRFHIGLPNIKQRMNILEIILRQEVLDESVDLGEIARTAEGLSGSDLRELCRTAAICRLRECMNSRELDEEHVPCVVRDEEHVPCVVRDEEHVPCVVRDEEHVPCVVRDEEHVPCVVRDEEHVPCVVRDEEHVPCVDRDEEHVPCVVRDEEHVPCVVRDEEHVPCVVRDEEHVPCVDRDEEHVPCVVRDEEHVPCVVRDEEHVPCVVRDEEHVPCVDRDEEHVPCVVRDEEHVPYVDRDEESVNSSSLRPIKSSDFDVALGKMKLGGKHITNVTGFNLD